jgi:hypothetical protein
MNKDADQESFCSDSDDAGTSDSSTVALCQAAPPLLFWLQHKRPAVFTETRNGTDINTRNSILTVADNRGLCLSGMTVQQVHTFVAVQAGLV